MDAASWPSSDSSRFGPTAPDASAAENVWQLPQPWPVKISLPAAASPSEAGGGGGGGSSPVVVPGGGGGSFSVVVSPAATSSFGSTAKTSTAPSVATSKTSVTTTNQRRCSPGKSGQRRGIRSADTSAKTTKIPAMTPRATALAVVIPSSTARNLPGVARRV